MPPLPTPVTVRPPNEITLETTHALIAKLRALDVNRLPNGISLDLRYLSFIDPAGVVVLANVVE